MPAAAAATAGPGALSGKGFLTASVNGRLVNDCQDRPCFATIATDMSGSVAGLPAHPSPSLVPGHRGPPAWTVDPVAPHPPRPKTSELLAELHDAFPGDKAITVRDVLDRLEGRAFGLLLLFLALPNCIPNIPGISTIFGILLIPPALQMIFGAGKVWLPRRITDMTIQPSTLRNGIDAFMPMLRKVERFVTPRASWATEKPVTVWFGIQTLILALVLMLPIPFGNWPPGMATAALAIALIQRDGVFAAVSFGFFLASLAILPLGIGMGLAALDWLIGALAGAAQAVAGLFG